MSPFLQVLIWTKPWNSSPKYHLLFSTLLLGRKLKLLNFSMFSATRLGISDEKNGHINNNDRQQNLSPKFLIDYESFSFFSYWFWLGSLSMSDKLSLYLFRGFNPCSFWLLLRSCCLCNCKYDPRPPNWSLIGFIAYVRSWFKPLLDWNYLQLLTNIVILISKLTYLSILLVN